jgi:hypothetical protein
MYRRFRKLDWPQPIELLLPDSHLYPTRGIGAARLTL